MSPVAQDRSAPTASLPLKAGLFVFALSLAVRLIHYWFVRETPLASDFIPDLAPYLFMAGKLMTGEFLFRQPMVMSPGYPLFLLPALRLFGPDVPLLVLQNALFDAGTSVLAAALAARLSPQHLAGRAALCAGVLHALNGPLLFYALLPLGEGPAMFLLLAALLLLADAPARGPAPWLSGALFGLAALLRPNLAPAALLAAWTLPFGPGTPPAKLRVLAALRVTAAMLLTFLPFMAHNLAMEGRATPFGFQGGLTFYAGNSPDASGVGDAMAGISSTPYVLVLEARAEASRLAGRPLSLAEADGFWYARAGRFLVEQPLEAARLLGVKSLLLVNTRGWDSTVNLDFSRRFSPVPALLPLPFGLALGLAALGLVSTRRSPARTALLVALAATAIFTVLFLVTPRYRTMTLALLMPLAGVGLAALPGLARAGSRWLVAAAALLALSLVPAGRLVSKSDMEAQELVRLGAFYVHTGRPEEAAQVLDRAQELGGQTPQAQRLRRMAEILSQLRASEP